jgi:sporulation protein YlmC with PRC-barrel domain
LAQGLLNVQVIVTGRDPKRRRLNRSTRAARQESLMSNTLRKTLLAGAIAALLAAPAWGQTDISEPPAGTPGAETGQPMQEDRTYSAPDPATSSNPLYTLTPNDLRRGEVIDASGEKVGNIKTVVLEPETESIHAVISSGGILGFGAREIVVSFDELQMSDDKIQVTATKQELQGRGEYVPEEYVELEPDRPISEFSAFEPMPDREEPGSAVVPEPPR